jgi:Leucine-rich repeat (LRR) protein
MLVKLEKLTLQANKLIDIKVNSPFVKQLDFTNNLLKQINIGSFENCSSLLVLILSHNRIIKIEKQSFINLYRLHTLNLSHNYLDGLADDVFDGLANVTSLDLSFNFVKILSSNFLRHLKSLVYLQLNNNQLKVIDSNSFSHLTKLNCLNIEFNLLFKFEENILKNSTLLLSLNLKSNLIKSINALKTNLKFLSSLERIDLSSNKIEQINGADFEFNLALKSIILNENPIKFISTIAFKQLSNLEVFKISKIQVDFFDLSTIPYGKIIELDLSFTRVSLEKCDFNYWNYTKILTLEKVDIIEKNFSIEMFLHSDIVSLDFSQNEFRHQFDNFNKLVNLQALTIRNVSLESLDQIEFENFLNLNYLGLSSNLLTRLDEPSFFGIDNLQYLDLSYNSIYFIHKTIFSRINKLKYLNLENNRIFSIGSELTNFLDIETFKISRNLLTLFPVFTVSLGKLTTLVPNLKELSLNYNKINSISFFSVWLSYLEFLSFDSNEISIIKNDAFINLKQLKDLSISRNSLTNLSRNNFQYLFSLLKLNLSYNRIEIIEEKSFENLNKLSLLDLSYNSFKILEDHSFRGLTFLKDLYLLNTIVFQLKPNSFDNLLSISNIYLNESMLISTSENFTNNCIFMFAINRTIQRNIRDTYIYYRSLNLMSFGVSIEHNLSYFCNLTFNLIQFNIHFNLKSDYENELFYTKCKNILIDRRNNFNHNKKKCYRDFEFSDRITLDDNVRIHVIFKILTNEYFLLSVILLLFLIIPAFFYILFFQILSIKN